MKNTLSTKQLEVLRVLKRTTPSVATMDRSFESFSYALDGYFHKIANATVDNLLERELVQTRVTDNTRGIRFTELILTEKGEKVLEDLNY